MRQFMALSIVAVLMLGMAGCVAKVETDPAPARVNVDVDPPPKVDVKVD